MFWFFKAIAFKTGRQAFYPTLCAHIRKQYSHNSVFV